MDGGTDIAALKTALAAAEVKASEAEARAANAEAKVSDAAAEIAFLKLTIKKLQRELFGTRSERKQRLLDQLELQLDELEANATEDELAAEAASETTRVAGFTRRRTGRKPFPAHIPRERKVVPPPTFCACCGSEKLSKIGEDVTETLEAIPRRWKVIQTVREKFTCRACEKIGQPPAPFQPDAAGLGRSQPAGDDRVREVRAAPAVEPPARPLREGGYRSQPVLADQVGACAVALKPLHDLIEAHVMAADRLHGDDTKVPVLARGKCATGRAWVYVRDDAPFGGADPPAALFRYAREPLRRSPGRAPGDLAGILQTDIYAGYNALYAAGRSPGPVTEAACWAHSRRKPAPDPFRGSSSSPTSRRARDGATRHRRSRPWRWRR